jgi:hypothetical protein
VDFKPVSGQFKSPGGFTFGIQGWEWGAQMPTAITFYLDGTAQVCDQHGRPIRGAVVDAKEIKFAICPPPADMADPVAYAETIKERNKLARHAEVIAALYHERVDWQKLTTAGWPQLSYDELKKLPHLPPTPVDELWKIKDPELRRAAIKVRLEMDSAREIEAQTIEAEMEVIRAEVEAAKQKRDVAMRELVSLKKEAGK